MKKLSISLIILMLINILLVSCTDQNNAAAPPKDTPGTVNQTEEAISEYFPLEVGNRWSYEGYGNEFASYTQQVVYKKDNKYQTMSDNGGTTIVNVIKVESDKIINIFRLGEAYEDKNFLDEPSNLHIELLRLPIAVGNSWVSEENTYEIVKTDETLIVPYGKLDNCVVVKTSFRDGTIGYSYYKKGIGLVQSDFIISDTDVISSKLKEFVIK